MLRRSVEKLGQAQSKMTPATRVRVTPSESNAANARMTQLRETRIKHGASSEAYKNATEAHQQAAPRRIHGAETDDETVDDDAYPAANSF